MNQARRTSGHPRRASLGIPMAVLAFVATACAGDVGQYRDALSTGDQAVVGIDEDVSQANLGSGAGATDGAAPVSGAAPGPAAATGQPGGAEASGGPAGGEAGAAPDAGAATGSPAPTTPAPAATAGSRVGVTPTQVTLGLIFPESGPYSGLTRNFPLVARAAFEEVNAAGGIHGRTLVLRTYDDAGSNAETVTANTRRARDETFALMSVVNTTSEIVAPLAERDGLPFFPTSFSAALGRTLRYSFAGYPYWDTQATILPGFIINRLQAQDQTIGVVFESTEPARHAKDVFVAEARRAGLTVSFDQPVATNQASCVNEVSNLQSRNVELVVMIAGPLAAICMLRDSGVIGFDPTWAGFGSMWGVSAVSSASGGAANGISLLGSETTLETPAGRRYSDVMRRYGASGAESDDASIRVFGITQLLIEALRRAGPDLTRERLVQVMETEMSGFDSGIFPPPRFGPGDRSGPQAVSVIQCCTQNNRWTTDDPTWRERF